jgi:hypothetical protein
MIRAQHRADGNIRAPTNVCGHVAKGVGEELAGEW